jgi:hypothetical protein
MRRAAIVMFLTGIPIAAPALGQAVYRVDPPAKSDEYRYAHRPYPQFRSETSRARRRQALSPRNGNGGDQRAAQPIDRVAIENRINELQSENAALKKELATRLPEETRAALENQIARLQHENAALKKDLATRLPEDRGVALENQNARLENENAALKNDLAIRGAETHTALQHEIERLQRENIVLRKNLSASAPSALPAAQTELPATGAGRRPKDNADLDRRAGFIEKAWRRLIEIVGHLKRG